VVALAVAIAGALDANTEQAKRAAQLSKADLLTDMVGEFPELQGIMGTYYARHDGEADEVATAIGEHYQPRFAGDALPTTRTGTVVAMADKLETLVGIWGIGLAPSGDKDPFALRRHALGIIRMLMEQRLPLSISHLLSQASQQFAGNAHFNDPAADAKNFVYDRLRGQLRERGYAQDAIEAVVAPMPDRLDDIIERLDAVKAFAALPEAQSLAAANKRITNILKKNEGTQGEVQPGLLVEAAEQRLYGAMTETRIAVDKAFANGDFTATLKALANLRDDVDAFFNDVMVMAEDAALRANRLALLQSLHAMMNRVADISRLAA
jgi:glycyl-tRNA synthetase beta chain